LDLVLSVLFLFQIFGMAESMGTSLAAHAESVLSIAPCRVVATAAALSYSSSLEVFGPSAAVMYDYGKIDPDYSVKRVGGRIYVQVTGLEGNYVCVVDIP